MTASTLLCHASYIPINNDNAVTNLGIGTSTPQASLVVTNGNVGLGTWTAANARLETDGFKLSTSPSAGYVLVSSSTGIGTWMAAGTLPVTATVTPAGNNRAVQYNNSSALGGDESKFAFDGTNVGIGSVAPVQKLSIVGNIGIGTVKDGDRFLLTAPPNGGMIVEGNVGIGTSTPQTAFTVTNGNVGIGTWTAAGGGLIVKGIGNVGISTTWPGSKFEVNNNTGTYTNVARFINSQASLTFNFDGTTPVTGVWSTTTGAYYETQIGVSSNTDLWIVQNNAAQIKIDHNGGVRITNTSSFAVTPATTISSTLSVPSSNVGIGTSSLQTAFAVTNGNVGIATWSPTALFQINQPAGSPFVVTSVGNVGVGTTTPQDKFIVTSGNVGINTWAPLASLQINQPTGSPFVVTSVGNVGVGTTTPQDKFIVTSGNVGINTWAPLASLQINQPAGSPFVVTSVGNVGVGTTTPQGGLVVSNGNMGVGTFAPRAALQVNNNIVFRTEISQTCTDGGSITIDWNKGNKQKLLLTDNACSVTFTAPGGPSNLLLKVVQSAGGSDTLSWTTTVLWPSGTVPTLTTTGSAVDILSIYYDGSSYYGVASLDLR